MTNSITTLRKTLTDHLNDNGLTAESYWPARMSPPVVIVDADDPWISAIDEPSFDEESQQFKAKAAVTFRVTVIAGTDSESARDDLDDMTIKTLALVGDFDWKDNSDVAQVVIQAQNGLYLASRFTVTTEMNLEGGL